MQLCVAFLEKKVALVREELSVLGNLSLVTLGDENGDNLRVIWRISAFLPNGTAVSADN